LDSFNAIAERQLATQRSGEGRLRVISIYGDPVMNELRNAGVDVEEVPGIESALALVVRAEGRVVLVTFTSAATYLAQNSGVAASLLHAFTIGYSDFYLAIARTRPGAADLTDRFNRAIEALRLDGTVEAILVRYGFTQASLGRQTIQN
jgi:ABC-type amino acid transport substrate-binding protein